MARSTISVKFGFNKEVETLPWPHSHIARRSPAIGGTRRSKTRPLTRSSQDQDKDVRCARGTRGRR